MAKNILLIEEEKAVEGTVKKMLKKDGFELVFAPKMEDALELARDISPVLILLDGTEPASGGLDACRLIRKDKALAEIPIIARVNLPDKTSKLNALSAGVDDLIASPYDAVELRARIHFLTRLKLQAAQKAGEIASAFDTTLAAWATALEQRDEPKGHTRRVTELLIHMAKAMQVPEGEIDQLRRGAFMHDIGKMGVPDTILLKQGALVNEEWELMRKHPDFAYQWLSPVKYLEKALEIPYCHHEKWDGSGYPRGLKGIEIPFSARLFALVDVWDSLRSDRPYRTAWSVEKVRDYIRGQAGRQFDPDLVEIFLDEMEKLGNNGE